MWTAYAGPCAEFPITLTKFSSGQADIEFILTTAEVQVYEPYPGHKVTVTGYQKIVASEPPRWEEVELATGRIKADITKLRPLSTEDIRFFSICVRIDTSVAPGLYDEFVLLRLSLQSTSHYGSLGFQFERGKS